MDRRARTTGRIVAAAAACFAKGGYAGTSMEEIAAAAGVSKLLLYRDFAGKRELYEAVLERTLAAIRNRVAVRASDESLRALFAVARSDPDGFILLFRHATWEPDFARYAADWRDEYSRGAEELLRPIEPDPVMRRWAAQTVVATTYEGIIAWLEHGDPTRDEEFLQRLLAVNRTMARAGGRGR